MTFLFNFIGLYSPPPHLLTNHSALSLGNAPLSTSSRTPALHPHPHTHAYMYTHRYFSMTWRSTVSRTSPPTRPCLLKIFNRRSTCWFKKCSPSNERYEEVAEGVVGGITSAGLTYPAHRLTEVVTGLVWIVIIFLQVSWRI